MKSILSFLLLALISLAAKAQVSLEHEYINNVTPFKVNDSTVKYFTRIDTTLSVFSLSHKLEKTIALPRLKGFSLSLVYLLSQKLFNDDDKYEFLVEYTNRLDMYPLILLQDEDGNTLFRFGKEYYFTDAVNTPDGAKLIMSRYDTSKVYALKGKVYAMAAHTIGTGQYMQGTAAATTASGLVSLKNDIKDTSPGRLMIADGAGRIVRSQLVDMSRALVTFDTHMLSAGSYTYILRTDQYIRSGAFTVTY